LPHREILFNITKLRELCDERSSVNRFRWILILQLSDEKLQKRRFICERIRTCGRCAAGTAAIRI
jgi:hypothetical protein